MAKKIPAKRANRANPREDRNYPSDRNNTDRNARRNYRQTDNQTDDQPIRFKKIDIIPRNISQEDYLDALENENNHIVFAMGPAGCGKSMFAVLYALKCLQEGKCSKIIITRPAVANGEEHGFLPGSLTDKLAPWVRPLTDIMKEYYSVQAVDKMIANEIIEVAALGFLRGRTLKNAIVIGDECQNMTENQAKMLMTRLGENSRMIITGDLAQHDRGMENNGLKDFVERLESKGGSDYFQVCRFGSGDIERHPAVAEVLRIYGE